MKPREAGALQHPPTMQRGVPEPQRLHLPSGEPDACPASLTRCGAHKTKTCRRTGRSGTGANPCSSRLAPGEGRSRLARTSFFGGFARASATLFSHFTA